MNRALAAFVMLAACSGTRKPGLPVPRPEPVRTAPAAAGKPAAPAEQPAPPVPVGWRASLAEVEHLELLHHPAFDVPNGLRVIEAAIEQATAELAAHVAALPDDSPDLPEAACKLVTVNEQRDRGGLEAQLIRGIAAARARANGRADQLYGSLHRSYLAVEPGARWRDGKLERESPTAIRDGGPLSDCTTPDVGTLRVMLAELYASEEHYPIDPFTNSAYPGAPTTRKSKPGSGLAELDALYREIVAAAPDSVGVATVVELAAVAYCTPKTRAPVCVDRMTSSTRSVAIRSRLMRAGDPVLADTHVLHARLLAAKQPRQAELAYAHVLANAEPGARARIHAALDLSALLRARGDRSGARALEASLIADLERPAGTHTWDWTEIARTWASVADAEGRPGVGAQILAAAVRGLAQPNPSCIDNDGCDNRAFVTGLLQRQAELDPGSAPSLLKQMAELERELRELRARHAAEVARMARK